MNQPILSKRTQAEVDKTMDATQSGNCRSSEALQRCGSDFMEECRDSSAANYGHAEAINA